MKITKKKVYIRTEKKPDLNANGEGMEQAVKKHRHEEQCRKLYPLRINAQTTIYVPIEKCNATYAAEYRERMRIHALNSPY